MEPSSPPHFDRCRHLFSYRAGRTLEGQHDARRSAFLRFQLITRAPYTKREGVEMSRRPLAKERKTNGRAMTHSVYESPRHPPCARRSKQCAHRFDHADETFIAARTKQRSRHRHRSDTRLNQIANALLIHPGGEGKAYMAIEPVGVFLCHKRRGRF